MDFANICFLIRYYSVIRYRYVIIFIPGLNCSLLIIRPKLVTYFYNKKIFLNIRPDLV